jgi:hypothetical protein
MGALSGPAPAEEGTIPSHPALNERYYIGAGVYVPKTSTVARLDSTTLGVGASVDFERALGMQTSKGVPNLIARIRFADRWRVEAEYFELNRTGDKVIDRDIRWGDAVYPVSARVISKFDFSDARVSVGYSFFKTTDKEVGVAVGAHVTRYNASLSANAVGTQAGDVLAPLPVVSAYGQFALTDQWAVGARLDRFSLSYDKYSGSLTSLAIDLLYQPFRHVGFGLGYRNMYIDMEARATSWTGKLEQSFQGPVLYGSVSF